MPKRLTNQNLKDIIGEESFKKLYEAAAGQSIYIMKKSPDFTNQEEKEKYICNLFFGGVNYQEIADKVGLSVDRVAKIINKKYKKEQN